MERRSLARSLTARTSATPAVTAFISSTAALVFLAMSRASADLPHRGGPKKMAELKRSAAPARRRSFPSPKRWSCPAHSTKDRGDMRSAKGASDSPEGAGVLKRDKVGVDCFRLIKIPVVPCDLISLKL